MVHGWLRSQGKKALLVFVPMVFMFATTILALLQIVWRNFMRGGSPLIGTLSLVLLLLATVVLVDVAVRTMRQPRRI